MAGYAAICGWLIGATLAASPPAPADPPAAPSAELLLFLAEFGGADGRYVDPTTLGEDDGEPASAPDLESDDEDEHTDDPTPDRLR